jgi:hypothetical protein
MVHRVESEKIAYDYMLAEYRRRGDDAMVRDLEAAPVSKTAGTPEAYLKLRDKAMHRLGVGTTRDMKSVITGLFLPSWKFPGYTLREKSAAWVVPASTRQGPRRIAMRPPSAPSLPPPRWRAHRADLQHHRHGGGDRPGAGGPLPRAGVHKIVRPEPGPGLSHGTSFCRVAPHVSTAGERTTQLAVAWSYGVRPVPMNNEAT